MFHPETAEGDRFEQVIVESVRQIIAAPGPDAFLDWARARFPQLLELSAATPLYDWEQSRMAHLLGTAIWNAAPHPENAFKPSPIVPPQPDAPCSCNSGLPYRDCCAGLEHLPELSTDLIWEFMIDELSEQDLDAALDAGAIPDALLARIADRWLEQDHPRRVVALLEPLFAKALDRLDGRYETAIDVLCDAYDRLDHWRKKQRFLDRLCAEGSRALQAIGWQRRSLMHIDEGDFEQAHVAFRAALRQGPDEPGTALLEITLLAAQHRDQFASQRARFWLHRFRRLGYEDDGLMQFLAHAIENPQEALIDTQSETLDPALIDLHDWVRVIETRSVPDYQVVMLKAANAPALPGQLGLFDDSQESNVSADAQPQTVPAELRAPVQVARLEQTWKTLFKGAKPFSIQLFAEDSGMVWEDSAWLDHLLAHPELADSLEVLDDLATVLYSHPDSALPWISHALMLPLVERAWLILQRCVPADSAYHIPWDSVHNRAGLRLLFRRYLCLSGASLHTEAAQTLEALLRFNPNDNHGARAELMNHYLREGRDEQAVALAQRFPNVRLADLVYGEVLALYRLGRRERAKLALGSAVHRLPQIPRYLTRKRIKQPRLEPNGMILGGDDQAWLYREAMRDVWAAEPGILDWLKRLTA